MYVNQMLIDKSGFEEHELIGKKFMDFVYKDERKKIIGYYINRLAGLKVPEQYRSKARKKDGGYINVEVSLSKIEFNGKPAHLVLMYDIDPRLNAEANFIESESKYHAIVDSVDQGIIYADLKGKILFINKAFSDITGIQEKEIVGKPGISVINKFFKGEILKLMTKMTLGLLSGKSQNSFTINWKDKNLEISSKYEPGLKRIIGFVQDITALKLSEQKYRSIFDNIQDVYYEVSKEGKIIEISPSIEHISGGQYKREELIGKPILDMYADSSQREQVFQKFAKNARIYDYELVMKNRDGSQIPIAISSRMLYDENGVPEKVVGVIRDISERKKSERALKESEERYRNIINGMLDTAWVIDYNADIVDVNNAAVKILGYTREELLTMSIADIDHNLEAEQIKGLAERMLKDKVQIIESWHTAKNGEKIPVEIYSSLITYGDKHVILSIARDVTERHKSEKALLKSREQYRALYENMVQGVIYQDNEGNIIDGNKAAESILGLEFDKVKGKNFLDLNLETYNEDGQVFRNEDHPYKIAIQTGKSVLDVVMRIYNKKLKEFRWVNKSAIPHFKDGNKKPYMVFTTYEDITEKKNAEKQLAESERFYRALFENSGTATTITDKNGQLILANSKASELVGLDVNIEGKSMFDILNHDEVLKILETNDEFIKSGDVRIYERTFNFPSGNRTFIVNDTVLKDEFGKGYALLSSAIDITDKIGYQNQIGLLSAVIEQSPVGILISNAKAEIEYVNAAFTKTMGYSLNEIKGKNPGFLLAVTGEEKDKLIAELEGSLQAGKSWEGEVQDVTKDGRKVWIKNIVSPVYNKEGKMTHFVLTREDTSEKKKLWKELVVAKEKAEESNRLKSTFLATMSHELRTPLNAVIGFSELILDISDNEEIGEFARTINSSGINLLEIIEDIFNLALYEQSDLKLHTENYKLMNIYLELKDSLREILNASGKESNIRLVFKPESGLLGNYITCDKNKVKQVIVNLFKNAVKFTESGFIEFGFYLTDNKNVAFYVKDTGIGIPADKIDMIFGFFRQVDETHSRAYGGVGIGLAISKKIADATKGSIKVESVYGDGSLFTFAFPAGL